MRYTTHAIEDEVADADWWRDVLRRVVLLSFAALPDELGTVMRYTLLGLGNNEIAPLVGVSGETVRKRKMRAWHTLCQHMPELQPYEALDWSVLTHRNQFTKGKK
jgi:DNA-directed RNA polymerase specialized sigma24 family protein